VKGSRSCWRRFTAVPSWLLMAERRKRLLCGQRLGGIDAARPSRRYVARERSEADEPDRDGTVRQRVDGLHFVQQRGHETRHAGRRDEPDRDSDAGEHDTLPHDAGLHIAGPRAEHHRIAISRRRVETTYDNTP